MMDTDIFDAFERFKQHLPGGGNLILTILKGHLLIEEQIWLLIKNRVPVFEALKDAEITSHQKLCLAEALIDDFTREVRDVGWLWSALKKLNKLRNDIAHKLSQSGVEDRIKDFVNRVPDSLNNTNLSIKFEYALWNVCAEVHQLIIPITPEDFENMH